MKAVQFTGVDQLRLADVDVPVTMVTADQDAVPVDAQPGAAGFEVTSAKGLGVISVPEGMNTQPILHKLGVEAYAASRKADALVLSCGSWPAICCSSSPAMREDDEPEPNESLPGFFFASATNSPTVFASTLGFTIMIWPLHRRGLHFRL